jgi:chemotaxis protein methyltransferase CheR
MSSSRFIQLPLQTEELSDRDYQLFCALIYEHSGITLNNQKKSLVRNRLNKRLMSMGLTSFRDYYQHLIKNDPKGIELAKMLDAISTNVTKFFREPRHFEFLTSTLFPRWKKESEIRILSAGCSSGEEVYSIAICARECLGEDSAKVRVIGIDISTRMLARAKAGIYNRNDVQQLPQDRLRRHFLRGSNGSAGLVKVAPEVQALASFERRNITEEFPFKEPFHAVFCRNVAIYFDARTRDELFAQIHRRLRAKGSLFIGHSESMISCASLFKYVEPTIYEKGAAS